MFNMVLQDGTRSDNAMTLYYNPFTEDGEVYDRYDYYLPQNKRATAVTIYYYDCIIGFRFHLIDGSNWDIGALEVDVETETVTINIADNEVIVGFKAKSSTICPA